LDWSFPTGCKAAASGPC
jgi:hypothetical protein